MPSSYSGSEHLIVDKSSGTNYNQLGAVQKYLTSLIDHFEALSNITLCHFLF